MTELSYYHLQSMLITQRSLKQLRLHLFMPTTVINLRHNGLGLSRVKNGQIQLVNCYFRAGKVSGVTCKPTSKGRRKNTRGTMIEKSWNHPLSR
jgi:hypothetical protein